MLRNSSSEPVVVPPGLEIEITTPDTVRDSPTSRMRSASRWLPVMTPLMGMRAIWARPRSVPGRPAAKNPATPMATISARIPATRQKVSLRRRRRRSAMASASIMGMSLA
jgi:hypothetical protein